MAFSFFPSTKGIPVTGKVIHSETATPLPDVGVAFWTGEKMLFSTYTDSQGAWQLPAVAPGTYDVVLSKSGFETIKITGIKVESSSPVPFNWSLEPAIVPAQHRTVTAGAMPPPGRAGIVPVLAEAVADLGMAAPEMSVKTAPYSPPPPASAEMAPVTYAATPPDAGTARHKAAKAKDAPMMISDDKAVAMPAKMTPAPKPAPPVHNSGPAPRAGLLTAGEWNDLDNWNKHWLDLLADGEISEYQQMYGFFPRHRFSVLLLNESDYPLVDIPIQLTDAKGNIVWEARTDNTGKAEIWSHLYEKEGHPETLQLAALIDGARQALGTAQPYHKGIQRYTISRACTAPNAVDIVWAIDATGSMGDEMNYLKEELYDVISRVKSSNPLLNIRMGSVFYRDVTDEYLVKSSGLSPDIAATVNYIKAQSANGGGDMPEAVHSALEEVIDRQPWSQNAVARICFLVLDASPHETPEINASLHRTIREAARKGIRIVPVSASGIQKDTEFLMKFFGLATNGSYIFLTDHSGIGDKHIEATTDEYKVESFNNLLVRIITQYSGVPTCEGKSAVVFEHIAQGDTTSVVTPVLYYPNPATDHLNIELPFDAQKVTLYNAEGIAVWQLTQPSAGRHTAPVGTLPAGYYALRIWKDGQVQSGKILILRME